MSPVASLIRIVPMRVQQASLFYGFRKVSNIIIDYNFKINVEEVKFEMYRTSEQYIKNLFV